MPRLIGPFKGTVQPVRSGLYQRMSPKTGLAVFSHFDADIGKWGKFSSNKLKALRKRNDISRHQKLQWYGLAKS